jgi:hypothetical protein
VAPLAPVEPENLWSIFWQKTFKYVYVALALSLHSKVGNQGVFTYILDEPPIVVNSIKISYLHHKKHNIRSFKGKLLQKDFR